MRNMRKMDSFYDKRKSAPSFQNQVILKEVELAEKKKQFKTYFKSEKKFLKSDSNNDLKTAKTISVMNEESIEQKKRVRPRTAISKKFWRKSGKKLKPRYIKRKKKRPQTSVPSHSFTIKRTKASKPRPLTSIIKKNK